MVTFLDILPFKKHLTYLTYSSESLVLQCPAEVDTNTQQTYTQLTYPKTIFQGTLRKPFSSHHSGISTNHISVGEKKIVTNYTFPAELSVDRQKPLPCWWTPSINKQPGQLTVVKLVKSSGYFIWEVWLTNISWYCQL